MDITKQLRVTLGHAIDAARAALRDLDADDVPARLRPVARRGDGTLPIPLVKTLLRGIDEDEWFRSKAIEAFERSGVEDQVSEAYLRADPGWWVAVVDAVAGRVAADEEKRLARVQAELETTKDKHNAAKTKAKALKKDLAEAKRAAKSSIEARLEPVKAAAAEARADAAKAEARAAILEADLERLDGERSVAERTAETLREELRLSRRKIANLRKEAESGASGSVPRDPVELGRWLDRTAAAATPYRDAAVEARRRKATEESARWRIPAGVAPDSRDAVESMAGLHDVVVLVDGHNLLGVLDASTMATARARKELVSSLGKLARHLGDASVEVVFDSDLRDGRPVAIADSGIVVRYAGHGFIADDVLSDLAAEHGTSAIVVSDDREVRERCHARGAAVLWARALAEWL